MNDVHPLRRIYDAFETQITPRVESVVHSEEFTTAVTLITKVCAQIGRRIDSTTARLWHLVNLPAGTDVKRLRVQVGSLDREVRQLAMELERMRVEQPEGGVRGAATAKSKQSTRPGT